MNINRYIYLNRLIERMNNGLIKVVTGIRRCGKSYLLFNIFHNYLVSQGVEQSHIIEIALDYNKNKAFRNADYMCDYVESRITDGKQYYLILDEVQMLTDFVEVLNGFLRISNLDIYVTGSNSKFLATDVITEFRGRGDEMRIYPLSFSEFMSAWDGSYEDGWNNYYTYGGLPLVLSMKTPERKAEYLDGLFKETYIRDIIDRHKIKNDIELEELINILASSIGSLTNPQKIADTFKTVGKSDISPVTVKSYLDYLQEAFIVDKALRYDIKGRKYISSPSKFYFSDVGLRNARLNFRQQEENLIMENIIYNELKIRGFNVDVGVVDINEPCGNGKYQKKKTEVDFVVNKGSKRYYIQSAFALPTPEKDGQEKRPLINIDDFFKKIIVVKDNIMLKRDERGIVTMGIKEFLMNKDSLDL